MVKKEAYVQHPGKPGKVQHAWNRKRIPSSKKGTPMGEIVVSHKLKPNKSRWLEYKRTLDSSDLNLLISSAVAAYK